jgi:hypothetical protein
MQGFCATPEGLSSNYPVRVSLTNGKYPLSFQHRGYPTNQVFDNQPCTYDV